MVGWGCRIVAGVGGGSAGGGWVGGGVWQTGGAGPGESGLALRGFWCLKEAYVVKKLLALAAVAGGVLLVIKRKSSAKAEAALWREATAPATNGAKKA
ncbi:hypothetical protein GCM10010484_10840 [Actinokineospora globicatena]